MALACSTCALIFNAQALAVATRAVISSLFLVGPGNVLSAAFCRGVGSEGFDDVSAKAGARGGPDTCLVKWDEDSALPKALGACQPVLELAL